MALHIGLVGLGDAGRQHAQALAQLEAAGLCKWTAICAREGERVEAFRTAREVPDSVSSYVGLEALLDAGVCDAVILATPDDVHAHQLRRCATRGVHALVEKPLATSVAAARSALELARTCQTVVRVGYHLRHHRGHRRVHYEREALIGPLRRVDIQWAWPDPSASGWRAQGQGGGFWSLGALGTHCIDLARWYVGSEPKRLAYLLDPPMAIDRAAELSLGFGRIVAHIGVSIAHRARSRLLLVGEHGEIECLGTLGSRGDGEIWVRELGDAPRRALEFHPENPYRAQLESFIAEIQAATTTDLDEALANLTVLEAIDSGAMPIS
jgi:predicted dehydrogenase